MQKKLPPNIRLLPDVTINQIAAGEVIENSASCVKELVENALDAGATSLYIETRGAGRELISVADDGHGMREEDLYLALERHATSKIREVDDLYALRTLGFRGEALPSIAAVSKMTLHSAPYPSGEGAFIEIQGGKIARSGKLPRTHGTTVEVRSLFYNVPVRKKFQKSASAELADIHRLLTKMALATPQVRFEWVNEGKVVFSLPANTLFERLEALLGEDFSEQLLPVSIEEEGYNIGGWIGKPTAHRPNKTGQYLVLNGRVVISPLLSERVLEGYSHRLPEHRFPLFVLYVTTPPSLIDVNVHPQKREVRFAEEERVGNLCRRASAEALEKRHVVAVPTPFSLTPTLQTPFLEPLVLTSSSDPEPSLFKTMPRVAKIIGRYFIVEKTERGDLLIDAEAAAARIYYERWESETGPLPAQALLLPVTFTCTPAEGRDLEVHLERLQELGFGIRSLGGTTFLVDALPPPFEIEEVKPLLYGLLDEIGRKGHLLPQHMAALIRKRRPTVPECIALADELFRCKAPERCPKGRLTYTPFTEDLLQRVME